MTEVYEYLRLVNGEMRREFVVFSSDKKRDILQAVAIKATWFFSVHSTERYIGNLENQMATSFPIIKRRTVGKFTTLLFTIQ